MNKIQALLVTVAFLPLGAVGFVAVTFGRGALEAQRYRQRVESLEREGALLPPAALEASDSPEAEQVRRGLERIGRSLDGLFEELEGDSVRLRARLDQRVWSKEHRSEVEAQLRRYTDFFEAVEGLVHSPVAGVVLERRERVLDEGPRLAEVREWVSMLLVQARLDAVRGAADRSAGRIAQGLALTRLLECGRSFGALITLEMRRRLLDGAVDSIEQGRLDPRVLLAAIGGALGRGFEEAWQDWILRSELSASHASGREPEPGPGLDDFLAYPDACRNMARDLDERLRGLERLGQPAEGLVDLPADFDRNLVLAVERTRSREALLHVFLAVRAYHAAEGHWPDSLELLGPFLGGRVPVDPWTRAPFDYGRDERGWVLGPAGGGVCSGLEGQLQAREAFLFE